MSRPITGTVVATTGSHTLTVREGEFEILIDVEDCVVFSEQRSFQGRGLGVAS